MEPVGLARVSSSAGGDDTARARCGDELAFRQVYETHRSGVARLIYRLAGPRSDVEELLQSVFLQAHRQFQGLRGNAKVNTWLHRITVNTVLMQLRAERRRPKSGIVSPEVETTCGDDALAAATAETRDRIRALRRLLARLTEKRRVVFVLHELEGISLAEISEILRTPVLTVRTRLFYARKELEAMLRHAPTVEQKPQGASC